MQIRVFDRARRPIHQKSDGAAPTTVGFNSIHTMVCRNKVVFALAPLPVVLRCIPVIKKQPVIHKDITLREQRQIDYDNYHLVGEQLSNPTHATPGLAALEFHLRIKFAKKYLKGDIDSSHWYFMGRLVLCAFTSRQVVYSLSRSMRYMMDQCLEAFIAA